MRFIDGLCEGETIRNVYLCKGKRSAETRNGKPYDNLILQDKTGTLDGKVWDPNSQGIADYDEKDFIEVFGDVINYNGNLQLNIRQIRKAEEGEYNPADYMPTTEKSVDGMYEELTAYIRQISNKYLRQVLEFYYIKDEAFIKKFKAHSAAKTVHHGFSGGLLEHTLSVTRMCDYFATSYSILNRDLLLSSAILHDIGKVKELSDFPDNDYTDEGQLIGHIVIGVEMLNEAIRSIPDFPEPGIIFRDITSILQDPDGLKLAIDSMIKLLDGVDFDIIAGAESRGFIFGMPIAYALGKAFIPVRKKGKLPCETVSAEYDLEYGKAEIEIHKDAVRPGQKVVLVDDLIATGGTMEASCKLVEQLGGEVVKILFLMELAGLKGREKLAKYDVASVITYEGK